MKKTLLAIALIASLTTGSALQARRKTTKLDPKMEATGLAVIKPVKPITDPKELKKQIRNITTKTRNLQSKVRRYVTDRTRAADRGEQKEINTLDSKIKRKHAKIAKNQILVRVYTLRLAALRAEEIKAEEIKAEKAKKAKLKKATKVKTAKSDK